MSTIRDAAGPGVVPADPRPYHHGDLRRALIDAALAIVTEDQDWAFSLRQVARKAGVSHNAPYNHFEDKQDLLAAVAAAGFESLRTRMLSAIAGTDGARAALSGCVRRYVEVGVENPALFRLMFGPALIASLPHGRPALARDAGEQAKAVLDEVVLRGARSGALAVSPDSPGELAMAALSIWSGAHGLTMLVIDNLARSPLPVGDLVDALLRTLFEGLSPR